MCLIKTNSSFCSRFQAFQDQHRKTIDGIGYTAIALSVLAALGGALLLYMHLSGLNINQIGFKALWHRISVCMTTQHSMTTAQILTDIVAPSGGSALLLLLIVTKAPQALWRRAQELRSDRRELRQQQAAILAGYPNNVIESQIVVGGAILIKITPNNLEY
ncbi:MAG: hypothetical protein S4CHLAM2_16410 [Chlamydiales bacterium]|nr:hypothetical protein [Chlamydiales bacterium]